jgi:hypothetical protein
LSASRGLQVATRRNYKAGSTNDQQSHLLWAIGVQWH